MVIRDLFFPENTAASPQPRPRLASPADRFIAAVFDFFIFSPVISLALSGLLREVKTYLLLDAHSAEAGVIWLILMGCGIFFSAFFPAIFLYHWGATPGQRFLHLKVVSWPHGERLSFARCFLRSSLALANLLLLGIPFLEIFTHPMRRAFHERASDTLVVTLVGKAYGGPAAAEKKILSAWMRLAFGMIFLGIFALTAKSYLDAKRGLFARTADTQGYKCAAVEESAVGDETSVERMDRTLALFLAGEVDEDCIGKETRRALWGRSEGGLEWAYLAAAFADDEGSVEKEKYFDKVCRIKVESEACQLAQYFADDEDERELKLENPVSVTAKILLLDQSFNQKNYPEALASLKDLKGIEYLSAYLEKEFVRIVWSVDHQAGARMPASLDQVQAVKDFKEKYGVE